MGRKTQHPTLSQKQHRFLQELSSSRTARADHQLRAEIILLSNHGLTDTQISQQLKVNRETVRIWRYRWINEADKLSTLDVKEKGIDYKRSLLTILSDRQRPGAPNKFTPEQICQLLNVACEKPEASGRPLSHWSLTSLVDELVKRGIVDSISTSQLCVFLKSASDKAAQS